MAISIAQPFALGSNEPIDIRTQVNNETDLLSLNINLYSTGMVIYVKSTNNLYKISNIPKSKNFTMSDFDLLTVPITNISVSATDLDDGIVKTWEALKDYNIITKYNIIFIEILYSATNTTSTSICINNYNKSIKTGTNTTAYQNMFFQSNSGLNNVRKLSINETTKEVLEVGNHLNVGIGKMIYDYNTKSIIAKGLEDDKIACSVQLPIINDLDKLYDNSANSMVSHEQSMVLKGLINTDYRINQTFVNGLTDETINGYLLLGYYFNAVMNDSYYVDYSNDRYITNNVEFFIYLKMMYQYFFHNAVETLKFGNVNEAYRNIKINATYPLVSKKGNTIYFPPGLVHYNDFKDLVNDKNGNTGGFTLTGMLSYSDISKLYTKISSGNLTPVNNGMFSVDLKLFPKNNNKIYQFVAKLDGPTIKIGGGTTGLEEQTVISNVQLAENYADKFYWKDITANSDSSSVEINKITL